MGRRRARRRAVRRPRRRQRRRQAGLQAGAQARVVARCDRVWAVGGFSDGRLGAGAGRLAAQDRLEERHRLRAGVHAERVGQEPAAAIELAQRIDGLAAAWVPQAWYGQGHYYRLRGRSPFDLRPFSTA